MADVQVACITKQPSHLDPHHGITHLGGSKWYWTRQQVVDSIRSDANAFFTMVNGKRANIGIIESSNGVVVNS